MTFSQKTVFFHFLGAISKKFHFSRFFYTKLVVAILILFQYVVAHLLHFTLDFFPLVKWLKSKHHNLPKSDIFADFTCFGGGFKFAIFFTINGRWNFLEIWIYGGACRYKGSQK